MDTSSFQRLLRLASFWACSTILATYQLANAGGIAVIGTLDQRYREATIVGAGMAGMLAAYALDKLPNRVTLPEQNQRAGGLIQTTRTDCGIAQISLRGMIENAATLS